MVHKETIKGHQIFNKFQVNFNFLLSYAVRKANNHFWQLGHMCTQSSEYGWVWGFVYQKIYTFSTDYFFFLYGLWCEQNLSFTTFYTMYCNVFAQLLCIFIWISVCTIYSTKPSYDACEHIKYDIKSQPSTHKCN